MVAGLVDPFGALRREELTVPRIMD